MSEDFDVFSLTPAADADQSQDRGDHDLTVGGKIKVRPPPQTKRFSTHLQPSDALPVSSIRYKENIKEQY